MRRPGKQDVLIVITSPRNIEDPRGFSPFDAVYPDELVFCCFFKEPEQRAEFLARVKREAGSPPDEVEPERKREELAREYVRLYAEGQADEAFYAAIRWWSVVKRRSYHAYSLKIGFAPYRSSCIIAFDEMEADTMKMNLARAMQFMEREKSRVLDFFGLTGDS